MTSRTVTTFDDKGHVTGQVAVDVTDDSPDLLTLANQLSAVTDAVNQLILDALGGF